MNIILRWFEKMFCKHKNRIELHRDYQDRYVSELCSDCGKVIYTDICNLATKKAMKLLERFKATSNYPQLPM